MAGVRRSEVAGGGHRRVEVVDAAGAPVPVADNFLAHLSARGCSPNTVLAYGSDLGHLWRSLGAAGLGWDAPTPERAVGLLTFLCATPARRRGQPRTPVLATQDGTHAGLPGLSPATVNRALAAVSSFYEWAILAGRFSGPNPIVRVADRALVRIIDRHHPFLAGISRAPETRRAALLTARWSGARRGEIQRLEADCLDRYPDGTARLRVPAGKTRRERVVPLHEEAATALRAVMALRAGTTDRDQRDERTGAQVRFLFVERGRLLSTNYLFHAALQRACEAAGLVGPTGTGLVTAHRFRHTVGTQLAERGAKLHTIMGVLGHESPAMAMIHARISDAEVLRDYKAVLGPGAVIAGPGAEAVRAGRLGAGVVDWLKTNFLKTELELGHCLRLPAEGPCECELFLTCSRFVTTPAYASRLRERRELELALAEDAGKRGWPREVERHRCTAARIAGLLQDLGLKC